MMVYHDKIEKKEINPGVIFQYLGKGTWMNVFHWNMADGSIVALKLLPGSLSKIHLSLSTGAR